MADDFTDTDNANEEAKWLDSVTAQASSDDVSERQQALDSVLERLLEAQFDQKPPASYGKFFDALYKPLDDGTRFRHKYSAIYSVLTKGGSNTSEEIQAGASALVANLDVIKDSLIDASIDAKRGLFKLIDHVNLEAQHIGVELSHHSTLTAKIEDLGMRADAISKTQKVLDDKQDSLAAKQETQQRDYVTILSVFAAIIIAFGTGTGFAVSMTSSVLSKGDVVLIAFVVSLVGAVLFNAMYALFEFLYRIVRRNQHESVGPWGVMKKSTFIAVNAVLLALILGFASLAYFDPLIDTGVPADASSQGTVDSVIDAGPKNG